MSNAIEFGTLLVPTDFSPCARIAFERACKLVQGPEATIIVLHVIDPALVESIVRHEFSTDHETVVQKIRIQALAELAACKNAQPQTQFETIVSEGIPFLEITRKADDFAVDAVVMGKIGWRGRLEKLLFGSTAEKVLRASRRPVLILPSDET